MLEAILKTVDGAIAGTDLLLVTPLALWGYHLAEAEGCPLMVLSPIPIIATGDFAFLQFPAPADPPPPSRIGHRLRRRLNRLSYHSVSLLKWRQDSRVVQAYRRNRGLAPLPWGGARSRRDAPTQLANSAVLHLFSPQILARPADWQESASVAGYCFLESPAATGAIPASNYQPADDLREFLDSGDRPFYAGFGSMIARSRRFGIAASGGDPYNRPTADSVTGLGVHRPAHGAAGLRVCPGGMPPQLAIPPAEGSDSPRRRRHHRHHPAPWPAFDGGGLFR